MNVSLENFSDHIKPYLLQNEELKELSVKIGNSKSIVLNLKFGLKS